MEHPLRGGLAILFVGGSSQGPLVHEAGRSLSGGVETRFLGGQGNLGQGESSSTGNARMAEITTDELKAKLLHGDGDQSMIQELVRRMEEVELRTRSSTSLHSALEHVHSTGQPPSGRASGRETGQSEVQGFRGSGQPRVVATSFPVPSTSSFQAPPPGFMGLQTPASNQGSRLFNEAVQSGAHAFQAPLVGQENQCRSNQVVQQGFHALQASPGHQGHHLVSSQIVQQAFPALQASQGHHGHQPVSRQAVQQGF